MSGKGSKSVVSNGKVGSVRAESAVASAAAKAERRCPNDSSG